jgi:Flp pilus assembly protein CpaB
VKLSQKRLARPSVGGMLASRQGALLLAFLCAVAAAGLVLVALTHYRRNLVSTNKQATVLVAAGEIKKGTSGEAIGARRLYKAAPVLSTQLTAGALSDPGLLAGKIAQTDILPGQQLTVADFTAVAGVVGQLQPGQRAVSISIDEAHGDTDVVQAGDRVDLYGSFAQNGNQVLSLLVPNALVIKPSGAAPATSGGTAVTGTSMVFAVSSAQAALIAFTSDNAKLWVLLRPANASAPTTKPTTLQSILSSLPGSTGSSANTTTGNHP